MKSELDILREVSEKLGKAGINYMLSGSIALSYYTQPRMTRDVDIIIELFPQGITKFLNLFKDGYYISPEAVSDAVSKEFTFNIIHTESAV